MKIKYVLLCLPLLSGCDLNSPDEHTPVRDNNKYHEYFVECLDKMANMPGRQQIKYNGDVVGQCDSSAQKMATIQSNNWGINK